MNESHENANEHQDENQSILRFEKMLKNNEFYFFDVDEFEGLIDHYIEIGNPKHALKAVEMGCEQHPSAFSLLLYKAQLLASTHKPRKALEVLNKVEAVEPNNIDVLLIKGTVFSQLREYRKAIDSYRMAIPIATKTQLEFRSARKKLSLPAFFDVCHEIAISTTKYAVIIPNMVSGVSCCIIKPACFIVLHANAK